MQYWNSCLSHVRVFINPQCKCIANGLHCTEMCRLTSCSNMQPDDQEPEAVVDSEDESDYESDGEDERY